MRIDEVVHSYMGRMKEDESHLLFRRRVREFRCQGSWSARLSDCGYHTNHVHPHGWIKFGEPSFDADLHDPIRRMVQPIQGGLVLFPSCMWHGTVPFHSLQQRTTIAFDAVPAKTI